MFSFSRLFLQFIPPICCTGLSMTQVRTRFAPSPTGFLHLGNARAHRPRKTMRRERYRGAKNQSGWERNGYELESWTNQCSKLVKLIEGTVWRNQFGETARTNRPDEPPKMKKPANHGELSWEALRHLGGRYWVRTSDPCRVKAVLYR